MDLSHSKSSQKSLPHLNQTLSKGRLLRLRRTDLLLGQPDIITVIKTRITSSLFSKQKKHQQISQFFINGIIFPTTAHFSTYISSKYQNHQHNNNNNNKNYQIKAKLYMFDVVIYFIHNSVIGVPIKRYPNINKHSWIIINKSIFTSWTITKILIIRLLTCILQFIFTFTQSIKLSKYCTITQCIQIRDTQGYYQQVGIVQFLKVFYTFIQNDDKINLFSSLREMKKQIYTVFTSELEFDYLGNLVLQILIDFGLKNKFNVLVDYILNVLNTNLVHKIQFKDLQYLNYKVSFYRKQYSKILKYSSNRLLQDPGLSHWKQLQIQTLYKLKNYPAIKHLGQNLIRNGGTHPHIYNIICLSYLQQKQPKQFLHTLNTILTLFSQSNIYLQQSMNRIKKLYLMQIVFNKGQSISAYPELCFLFDNEFLNRQNRMGQYKEMLKTVGVGVLNVNMNKQNNMNQNSYQNNNTQYQQGNLRESNHQQKKYDSYIQMLDLIDKVDKSLEMVLVNSNNEGSKQTNNNQQEINIIKKFYNLLVKYEKANGWSQVIKIRQQCFWLQSDFKNQQQQIFTQSNLTKSLYSHTSIPQKINIPYLSTAKNPSPSRVRPANNRSPSPNKIKQTKSSSKKIQLNELQFQHNNFQQFQNNFHHHKNNGKIQQQISKDQKLFNFNQSHLTEENDQENIQDIPKCSQRVTHRGNKINGNGLLNKMNQIKQNKKVLCCVILEKIFVHLYEDLKLQILLEKWASRINLNKIQQISQQKRQLYAIIFIKKAFLHLKLQRYKKCQQSLKTARKLSQSVLVLLISSYQLIHLYMLTQQLISFLFIPFLYRSMRGVQFYIIILIKIFNLYGIKKFDIVPEWAKQIISFIIEKQGIDILMNLNGPLKELLIRWVRNNYSENMLLKKDSVNGVNINIHTNSNINTKK